MGASTSNQSDSDSSTSSDETSVNCEIDPEDESINCEVDPEELKRATYHDSDEESLNCEVDAEELERATHQRTVADAGIYRFLNRDTDKTADVKFSLMDRRITLAHKYVLCRNPVFQAMFYGLMRPKDDEPIMIEDLDYDAFNEILRFLYYDRVRLSRNSVSHVLYAAKKYQVEAVQSKCLDYLEDRINCAEACDILEQSLLFDERELTDKCLKFIRANTSQVLQYGYRMQDLQKSTVCRILNLNELLAKEVDVFKKCVDWAREKCVIADGETSEVSGPVLRVILAEILPLIRFPTMSLKDFENVVLPMKILTDTECSEVFTYFNRDDHPLPKTTAFSTISRRLYPEERFWLFPNWELSAQTLYASLKTVSIIFHVNFETNVDVHVRSLLFSVRSEEGAYQPELFISNIYLSQGGAYFAPIKTGRNYWSLTEGFAKDTMICLCKNLIPNRSLSYSAVVAIEANQYFLRAGSFTITYVIETNKDPEEAIRCPMPDPEHSEYIVGDMPNFIKQTQKHITCKIDGTMQPLRLIELQKCGCQPNPCHVMRDDPAPKRARVLFD